jgi:hypothetical protein
LGSQLVVLIVRCSDVHVQVESDGSKKALGLQAGQQGSGATGLAELFSFLKIALQFLIEFLVFQSATRLIIGGGVPPRRTSTYFESFPAFPAPLKL